MPLDAEDEKKIAALIAGALKTNNEELGKQFVTADAATKIVTQTLTKGLEDLKLEDKIAAAVKKAGEGEGAGAGEGDKKKPKGGEGNADPAVARALEEIENLKKANKAAEEARQAAESRAREQALDAAAKDALGQAGVPASKHAKAMAWLRTKRVDDGKPVIETMPDGRIIWREQRKGYIEDLALADGIKAWIATDDGKDFLPPTGQQGTGTGGSNGSGSAGPGGVVKLQDIQIPL
jgi:hypothetical protein